MDMLQSLGSALGFGLLAGIRLYATVFALGLAIRLGWYHPTSTMVDLNVMAHTPVLIASGFACLVEFLADKIPWIDSAWDSVHTFIRPIGAALLASSALGYFDPTSRLLLALLCGGVALTGHSSKVATRLAVNHSPEPFSNFVLSAAEDLLVPAGLWVSVEHPVVALGLVSSFLVLFVWLFPKVFRLLRVSWTAMGALVRKWLKEPSAVELSHPLPSGLSDSARAVLSALPFHPLPEHYAKSLKTARTVPSAEQGVHCAARSGVLKNSTGYLCVLPDQLVFITKRHFLIRMHRMPVAELGSISLEPGIFLDKLAIQSDRQLVLFDLFKARASATRAFAGQRLPVQ